MRADLLALSPDALIALANRGLYKRAAKDVEGGAGPAVAEEGEVVRGTFADGVVTALPVGGLAAATCSCGAADVCRHVLAVVLAYQGTMASAADGGNDADKEDEDETWSPGAIDDEALEALLGPRGMAAARRRLAEGYLARVHPGGADDSVPRVDLPACTVRFLVPGDVGYARSDAKNDVESIALAVWAWRRAEDLAAHPDDLAGESARVESKGSTIAAAEPATEPDIQHDLAHGPLPTGYFTVGGASTTVAADPLAPALDLVADILLTGVVHLGPGFDQHLARVRRALDEAGLRWPLLAVDDLADQLTAYAERAARHQPERVAELLAELTARSRAAAFPGGESRARILGTEEAAEVQLRRVRLTGLGCRIHALGGERRVRIFLADVGTGTVLTLNHRWPEEPAATTGHALAGRRLAGTTVGALAAGNVVTETALRSADRRLRLGVNRIARTTVSRSSGAWDALPPVLLAQDLNALSSDFERLPPRLIRPRVDAEDVRVIEIDRVDGLGYHPGSQHLEATVAATGGGTATLVAEHRSATPAALDALAEALLASPRYVSATLRRGRGGLILAPIAVVADDRVIVPDLAPGGGTADLAAGTRTADDPLGSALESALGLAAEAAHRGARHLPPTFPDRLESAARALDAVGLSRCAESLRALAAALGPDPGAQTVRAWSDAQIRLLTTAEAR